MGARLFISYKRSEVDDEKLAHRLRDGLLGAGHEVFIDTSMKVGVDWVAEIEERIRWCDYLVVLLSATSVQSEMVQAEIRSAHRRRRGREGRPHILPVRVKFDGALDYELDSYLGRIQYTRWQGAADDDRVLSGLLTAATGEAPQEPGTELDRPALEPTSGRPPAPTVDMRSPGGTIRAKDPLYVRRSADDRIEAATREVGSTVVIKGARQVGKSSLLIRYLKTCRELGRKFALIDFQLLADADLDDYRNLLTVIAAQLVGRLQLDAVQPARMESQLELTRFIEDRIIPAVGRPLTIALDEVDRVLGRPYQHDFFSTLRGWHNRRAEPDSPWEDVDLGLVISTEPYLLIEVADRSPFNVTPPIELERFSRAELETLNDLVGRVLDPGQLDLLHELVGGQPYLTRVAYYKLHAAPGLTFDQLLEHAHESDGPFGEHLRAKLFWLGRKPGMIAAMKQVVTHGTVRDEDTFLRLHGAGLVDRRGGRVIPANLIYHRFFKSVT